MRALSKTLRRVASTRRANRRAIAKTASVVAATSSKPCTERIDHTIAPYPDSVGEAVRKVIAWSTKAATRSATAASIAATGPRLRESCRLARPNAALLATASAPPIDANRNGGNASRPGQPPGATTHRYRYENSAHANSDDATSISTTIAHHDVDSAPLTYAGTASPPPIGTGAANGSGSRSHAHRNNAASATMPQAAATKFSFTVSSMKNAAVNTAATK